MHDSIDLLDHYIESYEKRGIDFCFTSVHLQNVDTFEKVYGTGAAEMLVHQIADRLVSEVGKNSVILKGTGREFIIFSQKTDPTSVSQLGKQIASAIIDVPMQDNRPVRGNATIKTMPYSEMYPKN